MPDERINPFEPSAIEEMKLQGSPGENQIDAGSLSNFKDPTELTKWTKRFLYGCVALLIVSAYSSYLEYNLLRDFQKGVYSSQSGAKAAAEENDARQGKIAIVLMLVYLISGILWLTWIYRANYNARQLGATGMKYTPGWSVGWFFVPIANLWKPYCALKEIWFASSFPKDRKTEQSVWGILPLYWFLHLASAFLGQAIFQLSLNAKELDELITLNIVTQIAGIVEIPLCLAIINIVKDVYKKQMSNAYAETENSDHSERANPFEPTRVSSTHNDPWREEEPILAERLGNFKDPTVLTRWTRLFICSSVFFLIVASYFIVRESNLLLELQGQEFLKRENVILATTLNDTRKTMLAIACIITFLVTSILSLIWIYRANYNARQLGARGMRFTPSWAVGWWFVPIVDLWKPYQVLNEIWRASADPQNWKTQRGSSLVGMYWFFAILSFFISIAVGGMSIDARSIAAILDLHPYQHISNSAGIVTSLLFLAYVEKIYKIQMSHAHAETEKSNHSKSDTL